MEFLGFLDFLDFLGFDLAPFNALSVRSRSRKWLDTSWLIISLRMRIVSFRTIQVGFFWIWHLFRPSWYQLSLSRMATLFPGCCTWSAKLYLLFTNAHSVNYTCVIRDLSHLRMRNTRSSPLAQFFTAHPSQYPIVYPYASSWTSFQPEFNKKSRNGMGGAYIKRG